MQQASVFLNQCRELSVLIVLGPQTRENLRSRRAQAARDMLPCSGKALHARNAFKIRISCEHLIATQSRERHLHPGRPRLLLNEVRVHTIHRGLVHRADRRRNGRKYVALRDGDFVMIRIKSRRHGARVFRLREFRLTKND